MAERRYFGKELAERVRADQLQVMDIIYISCERPGHGFHRMVLVDRWSGPARQPTGSVIAVARGWRCTPVPADHNGRPGFVIVTDHDANGGHVWRVVDERRADDDLEEERLRLDEAIAAGLARARQLVSEERS